MAEPRRFVQIHGPDPGHYVAVAIEKAESVWNMRELDTIRHALERLQELEKGNE